MGEPVGTRDRIVTAGRRHIFRKGFHPTGLAEVLSDAGVPKGSFYHWFSSKEDLGLSVLDDYVREYDAYLAELLGDDGTSPLARLRRFFDDGVRRFTELGAVDGCLVGNLGQELADQDESFRPRLAAALAGWRDQLAAVIAAAIEQGELGSSLDPVELADFVLDAWEGALLRMKIDASVEPLHNFRRAVFTTVLAPA